jgi:hypothetical protein
VSRKKSEKGGALDRIGAKLEELPAARRKAIEVELAKIERKAEYYGAKRGRPPKLGQSFTEAVLVRCTRDQKYEMAAAAKRLGLDGIAEYLRELHVQAERSRR